VSGLPGSAEKKTLASTDFSSVSMPICCQPALTMSCSFWRSELTVVRSCQDLWTFLPEGFGSRDGIASEEFDTEEFANGDDFAAATAFTTDAQVSAPQVAGVTSALTEEAFLAA
jgi:hypothetical protein